MHSQVPLAEYPPDMPWVIVQLKRQSFGIASHEMREMLLLPEVSAVPETPEYVRGVFNLRGRVLPAVDLRKRLGMASATEETDAFCNLMAQREQDHRNWLAELEASVRERRPFQLARNPHQCAFGKWYDAYHAENVWIGALLKKFAAPHQKIHGIAVEAERLAAKGEHERVDQLIAATRSSALAVMMGLFADLAKLVREVQRETAVVLESSGTAFAVCVDAALSVEKLVPGSIEYLPAGAAAGSDGIVQRVGRRAKQNEPLMLIEAARILDGRLEVAAA